MGFVGRPQPRYRRAFRVYLQETPKNIEMVWDRDGGSFVYYIWEFWFFYCHNQHGVALQYGRFYSSFWDD